MRTTTTWILIAASTLLGGAAQAATFDAANSRLVLRLAGLPPIAIAGNPGGATSGAGPVITEFATPTKAFGPTNVDLPDSLFTGVPQIVDMRVNGFDKPGGTTARTFSPGGGPGGGFGGVAPLSGTATVCVFSCTFGILVPVPLSLIGTGGIVMGTATGLPYTVENQLAGWTTGAAVITGINTELVSFAGNVCAPVTCPITTLAAGTGIGAYVNTVTLTGTNNLSASGAGSVTLVTPVRTANVAGNLPLFAVQTLVFSAPEPATLLLVGSGVVALLVMGHRRGRRHGGHPVSLVQR